MTRRCILRMLGVVAAAPVLAALVPAAPAPTYIAAQDRLVYLVRDVSRAEYQRMYNRALSNLNEALWP